MKDSLYVVFDKDSLQVSPVFCSANDIIAKKTYLFSIFQSNNDPSNTILYKVGTFESSVIGDDCQLKLVECIPSAMAFTDEDINNASAEYLKLHPELNVNEQIQEQNKNLMAELKLVKEQLSTYKELVAKSMQPKKKSFWSK